MLSMMFETFAMYLQRAAFKGEGQEKERKERQRRYRQVCLLGKEHVVVVLV